MTDRIAVLADLAPQGVLTCAINYGNPVLAQRGEGGRPQGVSVALARALAEELEVRLALQTFEAAGQVFAALQQGHWALAFLAIEPVRAEQIEFSQPYVIIEGTYLVAAGSGYRQVADLDAPGTCIAVGQGAAYDLFLSRTVQQARLLRVPTSAAAVEALLRGEVDAAAGVRQPLDSAAREHPGFRVLAESFTDIRQAMAVPKGRVAAANYLRAFVNRKIAEGFVRQALIDSGQAEARVGPLA